MEVLRQCLSTSNKSDIKIERTLRDSDDDQGDRDNENLYKCHAILIGIPVAS
jgi:hypothetical protein